MPKIGNNCNLKKNAEKLLVILPKLSRFILGRMCVCYAQVFLFLAKIDIMMGDVRLFGRFSVNDF